MIKESLWPSLLKSNLLKADEERHTPAGAAVRLEISVTLITLRASLSLLIYELNKETGDTLDSATGFSSLTE